MPPPLTPLQPVDIVHLLPGLHAELVTLLEGLSLEDWSRPTLARAWRVRDVAAHLLDTSLRRLSGQRDGWRPPLPMGESVDTYESLTRLLNRLNAEWVQAANRLSPRILTELIASIGAQEAAFLATRDPHAIASISVAWAGETSSLNWFEIGREYTEKWHHQAQIRDAVGARPLNDRAWLHPFLDISLRGLPHGYRTVEAPEGTLVAIEITGDAGGSWCLRRSAPAWELLVGDEPDADARVRMDADAAWRLLYNALSREEVERLVTVDGNQRLATHLYTVRTVMV